MNALLILNMQVGAISVSPCHDIEGVVSRISSLAARFRERGDLVVLVKHNGSRENFMPRGSADGELIAELTPGPADLVVEKTVNDAFYRTGLDETLRARGVSEVFVAGCMTEMCVNATVQSALTKDYLVTVVKDCHTTGDRPRLSSRQIIDFYNWLWGILVPTAGFVRMRNAAEIAAE